MPCEPQGRWERTVAFFSSALRALSLLRGIILRLGLPQRGVHAIFRLEQRLVAAALHELAEKAAQ